MATIDSRLARLERRGESGPIRFILHTDGPAASAEELDRYNRTRKPGEPFRFTLRIDRASGADLAGDGETEP